MAPWNRLPHALLPILALSLVLAGPVAAGPRPDDGDDQYRLLVGLVDKGLYELAAKEAEVFLRRFGGHPKAPLARYRLATAQFELGRLADAAESYRPLAASEGFEYRAESAFRLGQCELSRESLDAAAKAFETVLALDQAYLIASATFFLGETEFRRGKLERARSRYEEVLREHRQSEYVPAARRGLVWCAWQARDLGTTVTNARSYLQRHADDAGADEVRVLLGEALLEDGRADEALAAFGQVRTADFRDAQRRGAGFAYAAKGEHAKAADEFRALVEEHPKSRFAAEARLQQGIQLLRAGDAKASLAALKEAARSEDAEVLYWFAQAQKADDQAQAALRTLDRALQSRPAQALVTRIHVARGDVLSALGRTREALTAYESGGSDYALYAAAVAALSGHDAGSAARLADTLLRAHPDSSYRTKALIVLGEAQFEAGNHGESRAAFEHVLASSESAAERAQANSRIGWCHYLTGDLSGAAQRFRRLVEEHPNEPAAEEGLYMLGRVLAESSRPDEASQVNALYLRRHPQGEHADEVLFSTARAGGRPDGIRTLEKLLAEHGESELVPRALLELADLLSKTGDHAAAARSYELLLGHAGAKELVHQARYGLGWCRYQAGDFAASAGLLAEVGGASGAAPEVREAAWELCIWAAAKAGDARSAQEAWRRFARSSNDETRELEGARTVVAAWRTAGRPVEGQRVLDELLAATQDQGVALAVLVEGVYLALEQGETDRAEAQVEVARRRSAQSPEVAEAAFFVAEARFTAGDDGRAIALYELAASDQSPVRTKALYKLGFARMRTGDHAAAARAFGAVADGDRADELWGESLFLQGEALYRQGEMRRAADAFERLKREAPRHEVRPKALFRLGLAYGELGRWEECEAALTLLARETPEFSNLNEAELWRGRALAAGNKRRAARQAFERVVANDEGELAARARLGLGRLLEDEGRTEDALAEYFKVAFLYAHEEEVAEALYRAGTCLETLGDAVKAREQYREVVERHPRAGFAEQARKGLERLRS